MASVYGLILDRVVTDIQGLSLSGILSANIVRRDVPTLREGDLPGYPSIVVSQFGTVSQPRNEGTNLRDDVYYPVQVLVIKADNQSQAIGDDYLLWQEKIRQKFINQGLDGLTGACVFDCLFNPRDTINIDQWLKNLAVGGLVFRFKSREYRG